MTIKHLIRYFVSSLAVTAFIAPTAFSQSALNDTAPSRFGDKSFAIGQDNLSKSIRDAANKQAMIQGSGNGGAGIILALLAAKNGQIGDVTNKEALPLGGPGNGGAGIIIALLAAAAVNGPPVDIKNEAATAKALGSDGAGIILALLAAENGQIGDAATKEAMGPGNGGAGIIIALLAAENGQIGDVTNKEPLSLGGPGNGGAGIIIALLADAAVNGPPVDIKNEAATAKALGSDGAGIILAILAAVDANGPSDFKTNPRPLMGSANSNPPPLLLGSAAALIGAGFLIADDNKDTPVSP